MAVQTQLYNNTVALPHSSSHVNNLQIITNFLFAKHTENQNEFFSHMNMYTQQQQNIYVHTKNLKSVPLKQSILCTPSLPKCTRMSYSGMLYVVKKSIFTEAHAEGRESCFFFT